jgi:serine/threonine-protein kinase
MTWTGPLSAEQSLERVSAALGEHFEITRMIDAAEGIEHYLAREKRSGSEITLRVLSPVAARDFRRREMFYLEAYCAIKLVHPNILRSSKPGQINGIHFVMLARTGREESLRERLARGGWLDIDAAITIAREVGAAIDSAHNARVLHLELNPANIFIGPDGRAMVDGFGINAAREMEWAQRARSRRQAAAYLSPEQASNAVVDHRSDIYSLGALLYEMLTDRVPFDSDDAGYIARKHEDGAVSPPHLISMEIDEELSAVVMRMLEKEPGARFASAARFLAALECLTAAGVR